MTTRVASLGVAATLLVPVSYLLFVIRPHVLYAGSIPFWILAIFFAALLTLLECAFVPRKGRGAIAGALFAFNLLLLLSQGHSMKFSTDTALTLQAARNFLDGLVPFPNFWYVPNLLDFSKNEIFWNYWWSPLTTWIPLPFMALFRSPYQGVHFMIYLCLLGGYVGWLAVARRLEVGRLAYTLFALFLLAHLVKEQVFFFYVGDIFPYAISPWLFWALLRTTDNFRHQPAQISDTSIAILSFCFGLTYLIKFSFVFTGVGYFILLIYWLMRSSSKRARQTLIAIAGFAVPIGMTVASGYLLATTNNLTSQLGHKLFFSSWALSLLWTALLLPGELIRVENLYLAHCAVLIYAIVLFGKSRKMALPLSFLLFALVLIPSLGLWFASISSNQDGVSVGRYRFSFAPIPFLLLLLPGVVRVRPFQWKEAVGIAGIACALYISGFSGGKRVLDTMAGLSSMKFDETRRRQLLDQSDVYTESAEKLVEWLNKRRGPNTVVFTAFADRDYELLFVLRGKSMSLYFPNGGLNLVTLPYYLQSGFTTGTLSTHRWTSTRDQDLYLLLSKVYASDTNGVAQLKSKFPQVQVWETVMETPEQLLVKGKLLTQTRLHSVLE